MEKNYRFGIEDSECYRAGLLASIYLMNAQHELVCDCDCRCDESVVEKFNIALANGQEF